MSALQKAITCSLHPKLPTDAARQRYPATLARISLIADRQRTCNKWILTITVRARILFLLFLLCLWLWTHSSVSKCTFVMLIQGAELDWKGYWVCAHRKPKGEVVYWWVPLPASPRFLLYCDIEWMYPLAQGTGMSLLNLCDGWGLVLHSSAPPSESLVLSLSLWLFHRILFFSTNKSQWFFIGRCADLRGRCYFSWGVCQTSPFSPAVTQNQTLAQRLKQVEIHHQWISQMRRWAYPLNFI